MRLRDSCVAPKTTSDEGETEGAAENRNQWSKEKLRELQNIKISGVRIKNLGYYTFILRSSSVCTVNILLSAPSAMVKAATLHS